MQLYQIKFCFFCVLHRHSYNLTQIYLYCGSQLLAYSWFAGELRLALVHKDQRQSLFLPSSPVGQSPHCFALLQK